MTTTTQRIEQEALDAASGIGKVGTQISLGIHHAVLAGGEPTRKIADVLHGTWLGHPLHPVLTDFTIGAWTMGAAFDAIGAITDSDSIRRTADRLTTAGTICAIPTAITGLTDFSTFPEGTENTATLHGIANTIGFGLYTMSVIERRRGNRRRGVLYSSVAFGLAFVSAWLGGHLVYKEKVGVDHSEAFDEPKDWRAVLDADDLPEREPKRVDLDGKGVLLYRDRGSVHAIGSVCSHAGGPLEDGTFNGACVQCPWHDSVFDLRDGSIVHGPATQPQQHFETRIRGGQIEIRLPE